MVDSFKSVAIFSSLNSPRVDKLYNQIEEILESFGVRRLFPSTSSIEVKKPCRKYSDNYIVKNSDLIIAIGGDGTLLSAARKFGYLGIPVLGINLGNVGFLADIAPRDLTHKLKEIFSGKFYLEERSFLKTTINGKQPEFISLNEVVVHSSVIAQLIEYELYIDESFVYRQKADGLLISTPTGSTGYSLSGNGPIIDPTVQAINLTPMFPHSLNTRPLIVDEKKRIKIIICDRGNIGLSFDSHDDRLLKHGDNVSIEIAKPKLKLVHPTDHDFYRACITKLGWSLGVPQNKV